MPYDDLPASKGTAVKPIVVVRHVHEPRPTIDDVLEEQGHKLRYADLFADSSIVFDPCDAAGLVVLGGAMNVDEAERYPFLNTEIAWLQSAVQANLPVLGICLGAQLLAAALGARVWHSPRKEIGWYEIECLPVASSDRLARHLTARATIFQWHGDTFDLPAGAVRLARSELCENQAFRWRNAAWGLQFHPEVTAEIIECWLTDQEGCVELSKLDYINSARIRAETPLKLPTMSRLAKRLFAEFAAVCREHQVSY
jgi:GMP synthase (glutamine-hydrolysing)